MVKARALEQIKFNSVAWFVSLMLVVTVLPAYVHNQFVTGPIVNAALFIAAVQLGAGNAILIGLVPSVIALASGLLLPPLAPMVPFIMISNAILIIVFMTLYNSSGNKDVIPAKAGIQAKFQISSRPVWNGRNYWAGVFGGALFKYAFLYLTSTIVVGLISNHSIAAKAAATMMAWPQIVTAVIGGIIAFGVIKLVGRSG